MGNGPYITIIYFFFFNDTAPTEIYPLSLHDALPISVVARFGLPPFTRGERARVTGGEVAGVPVRVLKPTTFMNHSGAGLVSLRADPTFDPATDLLRSEEHTSELQSRLHLVCRLLLEK